MPPSRRKSGNASTSSRNPAAQSTLAFNDKSARVTKPSAKDPSAKKATSRLSQASPQQDVEDAAHETVELKPEVTEVPIRQQPKAAIVKDEAEQKAEKVTDAQLKRYWKAEEDTRKAPRVHQQNLSTNEKILRHFDLSSQYGPCIGIPRLRRWKRANGLGLHPPVEVLAVLLREEKTNKGKGQMAYIDELAGGRVVLVE